MRIAILAAAAALVLAGCNTIEGFGRDMGAAGDAIAGAANDAQHGRHARVDDGCPSGQHRPAPNQRCVPNGR